MRSRSRSKYRGALSHGKASRICCTVHSVVGCAVTAKWTIRRRSCASIRNTEDLKPDGRHREEVDRNHILHVVIEERLPGLRWRPPAAHHVFTHAGFADVDPEFQQFTMHLRSAPERIFAAHGADEFPHFLRNLGPTGPATPYLPCPD